ncbi:hypothetical protein [Gloeothece verrucosa]|uniref:Uncharacterized protein n=1 Tax=Gloeothece verrucosa (strain PCC 7822) TaxID=497965 RepID=E0UJ21_GLOV7|nr:hypothetical protein [Gloeothece verrucosa]ADN14601.1 conserved hypothetical protein [Gloeothece verrucosa PCC 7822]
MDPISLILSALATGAGTAAAEKGFKDVYDKLKELIKKKFADNEAAKVVLDEHEKDPETYQAALKKKLTEAGADKDEEIKKIAQEILKKQDPQGAAAGKFNNQVAGDMKIGIQGEVSGENITQTF